MRLPTLSSLAAALLLLTSSTAADRAECLRGRATELADLAACGHKGSVIYCLTQLPPHTHLCTASALERCFVNAGCTAEEARIEAAWSLKRCDEKGEGGELGELRRRQRQTQTPDDDEDADEPPTTRPGPQRTTGAPQRTTAPPARTTAPQPETTSENTPSVEIVTVSASGSTQLSTFSPTTTRLTCFTTTTISTTTCPIQSTGAKSGKETLPCFPTLVSFPTCAAGLLCKSDAQGNPVCMKIDNSFNTAGVVISLFFAVAVTASIAGICFFCCRERRQQKRLVKAAEAAAIAKAAALDKKRPSVGVRSVSGTSQAQDQVPLMHPQTVVYTEDPFADHNRMQQR
jgi:hypothetical protein